MSDPERPRGRFEKLGDLLPAAARDLGLDDELLLAQTMTAWTRLVDERLPGASGACRLVSLDRGVATVVTSEQIVAQEIRLRAIELLGELRSSVGASVRELRVVVRRE